MKLVNTHILILFTLLSLSPATAQQWSLKQCIDTAKVNNKNLLIARNQELLSDLKTKETRSNLIPKLTANAGYKYFIELPTQLMPLSVFNPMIPEGQFKDAQFGVPHNIDANLQLTVPLYNANLFGAIEATGLAKEISTLSVSKSEEQLEYDITGLYYNAQLLLYQSDFVDSNLNNAQELLKTIQLLRSQLMAREIDERKILLQISDLEYQKLIIQDRYEQILMALKFHMGIGNETPLQVQRTPEEITKTEYNILPSIDRRISEMQKLLVQSEIKTLRRSRIHPTVNLLAQYGTTGYGYDRAPNTFLSFYPLGFAGIQLSYPIFNGMTHKEKMAQKKIEFQQKELQSELLKESQTFQVNKALSERNIAGRSIASLEEHALIAKYIYNQTLITLKVGTATITDVLTADAELRKIQQEQVNAQFQYMKANLELKKTTGNITK